MGIRRFFSKLGSSRIVANTEQHGRDDAATAAEIVVLHREIVNRFKGRLRPTHRPIDTTMIVEACVRELISVHQDSDRLTEIQAVLSNKLYREFTAHRRKLRNKHKIEIQIAATVKRQRAEFLDQNDLVINQFKDIALSKSTVDQFGDIRIGDLRSALETALAKIRKSRRLKIDATVAETILLGEANTYCRKRFRRDREYIRFNEMSGVEFERYIATELRECGYVDVRGTPTSGDQGADLITIRDGCKIVIQVKRHSGKVGNKAVQEVLGALHFYGGDEAWVVTNSSFTPSAIALAKMSGVRLFSGADIEDPLKEARKTG